MAEPVMTGGCQCGAIRYRISGPVTRSHLCHCRMCQSDRQHPDHDTEAWPGDRPRQN